MGNEVKEYGVDTGKVQLPQVLITPREFLDPDQISVFLNAVKGKDCEMAALLALHSLRRSELLALDKSNVNLSAGTITVRGAVVPDENNNYIKKETNKNASSARVIPIMISRLAEIVADAPDGQLVTCYANNVGRSINNVCRAANLPEVGVHGLRHSFASLAYHLGLSEKETMEIGGWADRATMDRIYTHVSRRAKNSYENAFTDYFKEEKSKSANENANEN
jgi:integrase